MEIRKLNCTDASVLRELRLEALKNEPTAFGMSYEEYFGKASSDVEVTSQFDALNGYILGAFDENELIAMAGLDIQKGVKRAHIADIWGVYVKPSRRKEHIARMLLSELIRSATELDEIEILRLSVNVENVPARKLYESFGFKAWGEEPMALKIGSAYFHEIHMSLNLR